MTYPIYREIPATDFSQATIERIDENGMVWSIPCAENNSDYQAYLRWLNGEDEQSGTL